MFRRKSGRAVARASRLLSCVFLGLAQIAQAATPASDTLSLTKREVTFTSGPHAVSNPSNQVDGVPLCNAVQPCDDYALKVELPADYAVTNPNDTIRLEASWPNTAEDFDIFVLDQDKKIVSKQAVSGANPEKAEIPAGAGTKNYIIRVVPFTVVGGTATVKLALYTPPAPPPDSDGDGVKDADDLCPATPAGTTVGPDGCPVAAGDPATCAAPGKVLLTDAAGDTENNVDGTDLLSLAVIQPAQSPAGDQTEKQLIAFRLKIDAGAAPDPTLVWFATFRSPSGIQGVRMTGDVAGDPVFQSYFVAEDNDGERLGQFVDTTKPAEAQSSFDAAAGTITIYVKVTDLGLTGPGAKLENFNAGVITYLDGVVVSGATIEDGMPNNDLSRSTVSYVLHDNTVCGGPALKPIAANPQLPPSGLAPRFYDFQSPTGFADGAGEPTIGYNPATKNAMFIAGLEVDRVTFAENGAPIGRLDAAGNPLPEACEPQWQNRSYDGAVNTLDPILETEQTTGRTFQSQLSGANSIFAFSDDDGETWLPGQVAPPNLGADHQTVGVGPWAPGAKPASATEDYAVYYCSQSVAAAFCSRSGDGGLTFGPGIPFRDSLTDCNNTLGGLHGHVQIARNDGSVYVPFGNCNDKAAVAVSDDSGSTWTVKKVATSTPADDPGLGIANDGTLYMCYASGGNKVFATVSKDRGDTWSQPYDLGAAVGVRHANFTTAVAGDGDRAACAFIGTQEDGNTESLDFKGVWYPYVATTYDGGKSWHTVNVSPGDPAQGWGGICTSGTTCGSNRNLLDFNDIIMDESGRVLFGYADGCRGACVQNPTQNTFSDNGVIARQSGGRTLLAAFDDKAGTQFNGAAPIAPAAACARQDLSRRNQNETRVAWSAPDDGGGAITNYKVYRAEAATGPFTFVGESGPKNSFLDGSANTLVDKYYYKVVAENAQGAAPSSNVIELPLTTVVDEDSCTLPGIRIIGDARGDGLGDDTDIDFVAVAEPATYANAFVITEKVVKFTAGQPPPDSFYPILFPNRDRFYIALDATGAPRFTYGTYEDVSAGVLAFTEKGTLDARSAYAADGTITFVVPRSLLGDPAAGTVIAGFDTRTRVGAQSASSRDTAGPADYIVRGTNVCAANTPPVAVLSATPQAGGSAPLKVTFDGSGSFDNDAGVPDTIKTYVISFGDGTSASAEGGAAPVWQHTYTAPGVYSATLRVTDSRNKVSENAAEKVIEIGGTASGNQPGLGNNQLGGSTPSFTLALLGLLGLARRRR